MRRCGTADQSGVRGHNPAEQTATVAAASSAPFIVAHHHSTRLCRDRIDVLGHICERLVISEALNVSQARAPERACARLGNHKCITMDMVGSFALERRFSWRADCPFMFPLAPVGTPSFLLQLCPPYVVVPCIRRRRSRHNRCRIPGTPRLPALATRLPNVAMRRRRASRNRRHFPVRPRFHRASETRRP